MTQLVGRILRQPHAIRTGVAELDESYVFTHRAETAAVVAAIKQGLLTLCAPEKDRVNAQIGVVECKRAGDDPFTPQRYRYIYTSISYKFGPDAAGAKRLFSILIITGRENQSEAVSGLRTKWGDGKLETSTVTNGIGQPLPKTTEAWRSANGTIELESPCGSVTTICMTYSDTGLVASLASRRAAITGGPATRF